MKQHPRSARRLSAATHTRQAGVGADPADSAFRLPDRSVRSYDARQQSTPDRQVLLRRVTKHNFHARHAHSHAADREPPLPPTNTSHPRTTISNDKVPTSDPNAANSTPTAPAQVDQPQSSDSTNPAEPWWRSVLRYERTLVARRTRRGPSVHVHVAHEDAHQLHEEEARTMTPCSDYDWTTESDCET